MVDNFLPNLMYECIRLYLMSYNDTILNYESILYLNDLYFIWFYNPNIPYGTFYIQFVFS